MRTDPSSIQPEPSPGESLESVPWASLDMVTGGDRRWVAIGVVVVAAAVGVSAIRTLVVPDPVPPVALSTTTVATVPTPTTVTVPVASTLPLVVGDVDLLAIDADSLDRMAIATAEWSVAEFFAADTSGFWGSTSVEPAAPVFVERVVSVSSERSAPDRWEVVIVVSLWDQAEDGAYVRRPPLAVQIEVGMDSDGGFVPMGHPSPAAVPFGTRVPEGTPLAVPDPLVVAAATDVVRAHGWGIGDTPPSAFGRPDGSIGVVVPAVDQSGGVWPLQVVVSPDGTVLKGG